MQMEVLATAALVAVIARIPKERAEWREVAIVL